MPIKHPAVAASMLLGAAIAVSVLPQRAHAQEMGQPARWLVRGGISKVDPKTGDLALSSTTRLGVDHDSGFSFDLTQMLSERWALEIFVAPSLNHRTTVDSATDSTPFGKVEPLIETLTGQYHFNAAGRVRPYVGVGLGYAQFSGETPVGLRLGRSWGASALAGVDLGITRDLFVNASVRWVDMSSKVRFEGSDVGTVGLDPMIYSVNLGYRFGSL